VSDHGVTEYAEAILVTLAGAGIPTPEKGYLEDGGPSLARADLQKLAAKARHLEAKLKDAKGSEQRWARRMMLLEDRFGFAKEVLEGKHDGLIPLREQSKVAKQSD
jgi:hypothetical protein